MNGLMSVCGHITPPNPRVPTLLLSFRSIAWLQGKTNDVQWAFAAGSPPSSRKNMRAAMAEDSAMYRGETSQHVMDRPLKDGQPVSCNHYFST